jgi:hypothetical protein
VGDSASGPPCFCWLTFYNLATAAINPVALPRTQGGDTGSNASYTAVANDYGGGGCTALGASGIELYKMTPSNDNAHTGLPHAMPVAVSHLRLAASPERRGRIIGLKLTNRNAVLAHLDTMTVSVDSNFFAVESGGTAKLHYIFTEGTQNCRCLIPA